MTSLLDAGKLSIHPLEIFCLLRELLRVVCLRLWPEGTDNVGRQFLELV
jgi:hypothetical protein